MTVFEIATKVPLLVHAPWLPSSYGRRSSQLVELVDLLPTVCELAGVALPTNQSYDGVSLVPILRAGDGDKTATGGGAIGASAPTDTYTKNSSFSQYPRMYKRGKNRDPSYTPPPNASLYWVENGDSGANRSHFFAMGHSMRTARYRYTVSWLVGRLAGWR